MVPLCSTRDEPTFFETYYVSIFFSWFYIIFLGELKGDCPSLCNDLCGRGGFGSYSLDNSEETCLCFDLDPTPPPIPPPVVCGTNAEQSGLNGCHCLEGFAGDPDNMCWAKPATLLGQVQHWAYTLQLDPADLYDQMVGRYERVVQSRFIERFLIANASSSSHKQTTQTF